MLRLCLFFPDLSLVMLIKRMLIKKTCVLIKSKYLIKLTIHGDENVGDDWLCVVVVVPLALQDCVQVLPANVLQFHCISGFSRRYFFPSIINNNPPSHPGDFGGGPT